MPTDRFTDTAHIPSPPASVYAHLMDPQSYIGLSPLLITVRDIHPVVDAQGREATAYVTVERFRFGPFHWDNPIKVTLTGAGPDRRLISAVISPAAVRLTSTVDLTPTETGTTLTEQIEVRSPTLLRSFVTKQARSVQVARLAELTRRLPKAQLNQANVWCPRQESNLRHTV